MQIRLPELSENDRRGIILTAWHVKEDSHMEVGQDMAEVATDKATFDLPAPCNGILKRVFKKEGEEVFVGEIIAEIEEGE